MSLVYYVQHSFASASSILAKASEEEKDVEIDLGIVDFAKFLHTLLNIWCSIF
jgi:hypothetical protein